VDQVVYGYFHIEAEVLLFKAGSEFSDERIAHLLRDHAHCRDEALSGAQGAHHQVACGRQVLFKRLESLAALEEYEADGQKAARQSNRESDERVVEFPVNGKGRNGEAGAAHGEQAARGPTQIGLVDHGLQLGADFEFGEPVVDPGNGAELLILAQIDDLIAHLLAFRGQGRIQRGLHLLGPLGGAGAGRIKYQPSDRKNAYEYD